MKKIIIALLIGTPFLVMSQEESIYIPSDPNATFTVLDKGTKGSLKTIVTKRDGKLGVTYSNRAFDCENRQFMYLGSGESLDEMRASKQDNKLSPIFENSIADYIGREACK